MQTALLIDGAIILLYFVGITLIGLYVGRREQTLEDYALGGRRVPWWAVMASIVAAETSAATFIGMPAEGYTTRGLTYVQLVFGYILGRILVAYIFLKPFYAYRVYTAYDFLAIRFGTISKNYISALFLVMRVLASGVRLYVPSLVLVLAWRLLVRGESVRFGTLDSWPPYFWAILILTFVTCLYTTVGGIKAVIWTDVIQATVMLASAVAAIGTLLYRLGEGSFAAGFRVLGELVPTMTTWRGYVLTGFEDVEPGTGLWELVKLVLSQRYTLPAALIGTTIAIMAVFGTDQDMVQRMLTARDYKKSRRSLIGAGLANVPVALSFTFIGVLLAAFYLQRPDLTPEKANDVFGSYIITQLPVVVRGFVLAGVFATAMGSLSAALNALATTVTNDWYIPYFGQDRSQAHYVAVTRVFTGVFAALMVAIATAFAYANVKDPAMTIIPLALGVAWYICGPMLGVFLLGMLTRTRGSDRGNVVAVTVGLAAILTASGTLLTVLNWLIRPATPLVMPAWMPKIEFTWYAMVGAAATLAVGLLFRTPPAVVEAAVRKAKDD